MTQKISSFGFDFGSMFNLISEYTNGLSEDGSRNDNMDTGEESPEGKAVT